MGKLEDYEIKRVSGTATIKVDGKQSGRTTQTVKSIKMRVKQLSALKTNLYDDIKDARPRRDDVFQVTAPPLTARSFSHTLRRVIILMRTMMMMVDSALRTVANARL